MSNLVYIKAIKRPFSDFKKFTIGVILLLVPLLNIITGFIVRGYQLECSKEAKNKKYKLPEWGNIKKHFIVGILSFIISFVYFLPALIVLIASFGKVIITLIQTANPDFESIASALTMAGVIGAVIATILFVLTAYIMPIALLEFVNKYKFKDAFRIKKVFKKAFKGKYLGAVLLVVIYYIILSVITSTLLMAVGLIPYALASQVASVIFSAIVSFAFGVTAFTLIGEVYPKLK